MATNEVHVKNGDQWMFADHAGDFGAAPTTAANNLGIGTPTDVQIDLTGVAASGGARESSKTATLGATRAPRFTVDACIEFETAPADGGTVEFYWAPTANATAANGNPGSLTGTDAAYTDTSGKLAQMQFIGALTLENDVINIGHVGVFSPAHIYGILVVVNRGSTAFRSTATAMDETHILMTEIIDDIQAAA